MSFYIWLDKDGKETKRQEKGRGRTMVGASQGEDGNWYIVDGAAPVEKKEVKVETPSTESAKTETTEDQKPTEEKVERRTRTVKDKRKISIKTLIDSCHANSVIRKDNLVTIMYPVITNMKMTDNGEMNMLNLRFNSAYAKIVIDKANMTFSVWRVIESGPPDIIVENALVGQDEFTDEVPEVIENKDMKVEAKS